MHGGNPYVLRQICVKAKKETRWNPYGSNGWRQK